MTDQAQNLRKFIENYRNKNQNKSRSRIKVITVASGKGGVGKSNFSVNLAVALKQMGHNVLVFDADLGMANVDVLVGVVPKMNLYDVIYNNRNIEDIIITGPSGIKIVPGGSGIESLSNLTDAQRNNLSEQFGSFSDIDILIIDTGAGLSKNVLGFMAVADEVVIVTTPEPTSLTDAYSLIKVSAKYIPKSRLHVVINRASNAREAELTYRRLDNVINNFLKREANYLGYILDDQRVKRAVMEQVPFKVKYPDSQASRCIDNIASSIMGMPANHKSIGVKDFLHRITYILGRLE